MTRGKVGIVNDGSGLHEVKDRRMGCARKEGACWGRWSIEERCYGREKCSPEDAEDVVADRVIVAAAAASLVVDIRLLAA